MFKSFWCPTRERFKLESKDLSVVYNVCSNSQQDIHVHVLNKYSSDRNILKYLQCMLVEELYCHAFLALRYLCHCGSVYQTKATFFCFEFVFLET